eukprot:3939143-Rhodomonas_salina.9
MAVCSGLTTSKAGAVRSCLHGGVGIRQSGHGGGKGPKTKPQNQNPGAAPSERECARGSAVTVTDFMLRSEERNLSASG